MLKTGTIENPDKIASDSFSELETGVYAALETYSNVHRGSGVFSIVSTHLFEQARNIVLNYLGLNKKKYVVIFCTTARTRVLETKLRPGTYKCISSSDIGLPLGVNALAAERNKLPGGIPFQTGGGTARLVSTDWIVWAKSPGRFEAGTPAIINVIAFARALTIIRSGKVFTVPKTENLSVSEILYHDELDVCSGRELLNELRKTMIGSSIKVPTSEGLKTYINLDNCASTSTFKPVWDTFRQTMRQPAAMQGEIIREVRSICAEVLGASLQVYDLIFTSNTTESINMSAQNFGREKEKDIESVVLSSMLEHSSNDLPWRKVSTLIRLPIDADGFVDLHELETLLSDYNQRHLFGKKRIRLVTISGASNVLGSYNNLSEISRISHRYGAHLFVDGAQMTAHRKVEIEKCGIDYFAFSAHKAYAPFGTGVLVVRKRLLNFNSEELATIKSSGEENAAGIAAMGKALILLKRIGMEIIKEEEQTLTRLALIGLQKIPGVTIYGIKDPDSANFNQRGGIIVFFVKGIFPDKIAKKLSEEGGIGVRYGCHCAHILIKHLLGVGPSLVKFQRIIVTLFPRLNLPGVVRVSFGLGSSESDIDSFNQVLNKMVTRKAGYKYDTKLIRQQTDEFVEDISRRVFSD